MPDSIRGKSVVITGAASGIGRATSLLFAKRGACVTLADIDEEAGSALAAELGSKGHNALFVAADVASPGACRQVVDAAKDARGGVDILFNNAGIIRRATVLETDEHDWDRVMAVNVKSMFMLCKYAIPLMIERGGGAIVNTASGWGLVGGARAVSYCASKGAVVQLTRAMAIDHGKDNIRVNCICPGDTDTGMLRDEARQLGAQPEAFLSDAADRPLGRIGRSEEIAEAVLYLASDAASFVTGTALVIDGGGLAGGSI